MACIKGWRNCEIAGQFGKPCLMPGHDDRTDAQKANDAHDEALDMEAKERADRKAYMEAN